MYKKWKRLEIIAIFEEGRRRPSRPRGAPTVATIKCKSDVSDRLFEPELNRN